MTQRERAGAPGRACETVHSSKAGRERLSFGEAGLFVDLGSEDEQDEMRDQRCAELQAATRRAIIRCLLLQRMNVSLMLQSLPLIPTSFAPIYRMNRNAFEPPVLSS